MGGVEIVACQGPPVCNLDGEAAEAEAKGGCHWCVRVIVDEDGTTSRQEPSRQ